jgi:hypothetical protein
VVIVFDIVLFIQHYFVYNMDRKIKNKEYNQLMMEQEKELKDPDAE